jgi:hypothetical protein
LLDFALPPVAVPFSSRCTGFQRFPVHPDHLSANLRNELDISVSNTFFVNCTNTQGRGGAISVLSTPASLAIFKCDFSGCQTHSEPGGCLSIQSALTVNLSQSCFSRCFASTGVHTFDLHGQRRSQFQVDSISLFDNGDLKVDYTSAMACSQIDFRSVNISHNSASRGSVFCVTDPELLSAAFCNIIKNSEGSLIMRKDWALKAEKFEFINVVKNQGTSLFEGELFATASDLIVFRNSFVRFIDITDQSIIAVQDSVLDYAENDQIFKIGGSQKSLRWKGCVFGVREVLGNARKFNLTNGCLVMQPSYDIVSELDEGLGFWDAVGLEIASNPHALGGVIAVVSLLLILVFAYSRNRMIKRMGYGQPTELDAFIRPQARRSRSMEPVFESRLPDVV